MEVGVRVWEILIDTAIAVVIGWLPRVHLLIRQVVWITHFLHINKHIFLLWFPIFLINLVPMAAATHTLPHLIEVSRWLLSIRVPIIFLVWVAISQLQRLPGFGSPLPPLSHRLLGTAIPVSALGVTPRLLPVAVLLLKDVHIVLLLLDMKSQAVI